MKIIEPSVEILEQGSGLEGIYKQIEIAGRACYASSHKIEEGSAKSFVDRMVNSGHGAMLEHGTVYLKFGWSQIIKERFEQNPYSVVYRDIDNWDLYVTTNYRVLVENDWLNYLEFLCDPTEYHERRVTARFQCQIAISREFNRHRVDSIAEQSTRYCNYSKDKFGNEITVNIPSWIDNFFYDDKNFEDLVRGIEFGDHHKDWHALDWWWFANVFAEKAYMKLIEFGWKPQQARTILPLDTNTDLVHTAFVHDWEHFFFLRCDKDHAHPDAYLLATKLREKMIELHLI